MARRCGDGEASVKRAPRPLRRAGRTLGLRARNEDTGRGRRAIVRTPPPGNVAGMDSPAPSSPPTARDVINADAIRAAIARRSQQRRDHPDIARWLRSHFFRWVVNRFAQVLPVRSEDNWRVCMSAQAPAPWFLRKLAHGGADMIYIDPEHHLLREHELRMVEFFAARLDTRLAGKFHRIAFAAADAAWRRDHERMQRRSRRGWWPSQPHALAEIAATPNGRFVELRASGHTLRAELAYESFHMQHCLGQFAQRERLEGGYGEHYARNCEQGRIRLFSLRDEHNRPHVTVSLALELGEWSLEQIKGKQNTVPAAKYLPDVLALLDRLRPHDGGCGDLLLLGLVAAGGDGEAGYVAFGELDDVARQRALLAAYPHLLGHHPAPGPLEQWLGLGARAAVVDQVAVPHGPVVAATLAMRRAEAACDDAEQAAFAAAQIERCEAALEQAFPQWLAASFAPADAPRGGGWLARLLGKGGPAQAAQTHRRWALALSDPLLFRIGLVGHDTRLAAPAGIPQRIRTQVESELGVARDGAEAAVRNFCAEFFRMPYFCHPNLLATTVPPGPAAADADPVRDLLAWHAMRQGYVLRLLAAWGLIDDARGWPLLLLNAQRVQDGFGDWRAFGAAAGRGHATQLRWSGEAHNTRATEVAIADYLDQYDCPWTRLSWSGFDLGAAIATGSDPPGSTVAV